MAGLVYESRLGSIATDIDGGNLVLYAVAAAVIGATSLFGGRGKPCTPCWAASSPPCSTASG